MRELLRAGAVRLTRSRMFWAFGVLLALIPAVLCALGRNAANGPVYLQHQTGWISVYAGVASTFFSGYFLGTEQGDGTLRNKLIAGHGRTVVFLSQFALCTAAALCFTLAGSLGVAAVGLPLFGDGTRLLRALPYLLLLCPAWAALFSAFALNANRFSGAMIWVMAVFLAVLVLGVFSYNLLQEPEFLNGIAITMNGEETLHQQANPMYLAPGPLRTLIEAVSYLMPAGQIGRLVLWDVSQPLFLAAGSLGITTAALLAGIAVFVKRDLQ